jgi:hypothetical protein
MTVMNNKMANVDMDNMAGLGISAWSRGGTPINLYISKYQGSSHIVKIDRDERMSLLQQYPERAAIPHLKEFEKLADRDQVKINLFMLAPLMGILVLALTL